MLPPTRIGVIVGRDLIGDALIKLPFARALRSAFPKAEICWITSQDTTAYAGALRKATGNLIDTIYEKPDWIIGERSPPSPFFDLLLDTRNRWKLARATQKRVAHKVFVSMALRYLFSDLRPPFFAPTPRHIVDRLLQMVELAAGHKPACTGILPVSETLQNMARIILPPGGCYVGLAPGAGNPVKIWPRHKFEQVAIAQAAQNRVPVFLLGPQELDWYNELSMAVPAAKFPLQDYNVWGTAQLTIEHTFAIAKCLDVAVANDSGVGHMLAAMDCTLISLFGPTSPEKLAPRVSKGRIIRTQDFAATVSMNAIPWESVNTAIDAMLAPQSR